MAVHIMCPQPGVLWLRRAGNPYTLGTAGANMAAIGKRFLNVLASLATVYLLSLLYLAITGGVADWNLFLSFNAGILLLCYGAIARSQRLTTSSLEN